MPPLTEGRVETLWGSLLLIRLDSFGQPCDGSGADLNYHPKMRIRVQEGGALRKFYSRRATDFVSFPLPLRPIRYGSQTFTH